MALTPSNMLPLGTQAPDFKLPDVISGKEVSLDELKSDKATVIMFICNHCPYVIHIHDEVIKLTEDYRQKGVNFIAISANDINEYPQDGPREMKLLAENKGFLFPYLYDETQNVARAYDAACTPDFYLFNSNMELVYRGRLDESSPGNNIPLSGKDLRNAIEAVLNSHSVEGTQYPSIGCSIKWKN